MAELWRWSMVGQLTHTLLPSLHCGVRYSKPKYQRNDQDGCKIIYWLSHFGLPLVSNWVLRFIMLDTTAEMDLRCHRICTAAPNSDWQYRRLPSSNESIGPLASMSHESHAHTRTLFASSDSHNPAKSVSLFRQPASERGYVLLHHRIHIIAFNFTASTSHGKPGLKIFMSRHCPSGLSL